MSSPALPTSSNESIVNVKWIDWPDSSSVQQALKNEVDVYLQKATPIAKETLKIASEVCITTSAEKAKTIIKAQIASRCPTSAPCISPVIDKVVDVSADTSKQAAPQVVNTSVDKTSQVAKKCVDQSIDFSVSSLYALYSRIISKFI